MEEEYNLSKRPRTTAYADWEVANWTTPHELQQSGTLAWLLNELSATRPAELRQRWADFERAFGARLGVAGGEALEQLVTLLHNVLAAADTLPVHMYASAGDGAHSLMGEATATGSAASRSGVIALGASVSSIG